MFSLHWTGINCRRVCLFQIAMGGVCQYQLLGNSGTRELRNSGTRELGTSGTRELGNSGTWELRNAGTQELGNSETREIRELGNLELNGVLGLETSDSSSDHPNFSCPFCTKIFGEKVAVVEHLDTCDGTEDISAMILFSVIRNLRIILTIATSFMIPPIPSVPRLSKERLK